ncbi:hypothetical protein D9615_009480 [Tricholomella constricta]|uniref:Uncharacterized protein n=1 Tax=Tricholomella constricta TaxID=117010 RepID=A0A8H5GYE4_9AGAR|nr:hypothetical protein D9615_009480 [Tricholomella constricta]
MSSSVFKFEWLIDEPAGQQPGFPASRFPGTSRCWISKPFAVTMFARPHSRAGGSRCASPVPSTVSYSSDGMPYFKSPSTSASEFEIERVPKSASQRRSLPFAEPGYENDTAFRGYVSRLLSLTSSPFSVAGRVVLDVSQLTIFFRTKSGITHSLDFPVDVEYSMPPPLEVLIGTCRPHQTAEFVEFPKRQSLFYPTNLPVNSSLDLTSHPIMDAVRNTLFPNLPPGHYITAVRDKLEVVDTGSRMAPQPRSLRKDGRAATILVTLPSRFEGGALIIHALEGDHEKYLGKGSRADEIEWTAFLPDCEYEIEPVVRGCRISLSYSVFLRTLGPCGPEPLIRPSDEFLDRLAPVLNLSRGRKVAFYLEFDYAINPAEALADAVVPILRGGDSILYHAIKLYKLAPELHWTAGGYIWPVDRTVDFVSDDIAGAPFQSAALPLGRMPFGVLNGATTSPRSAAVPPIRGPFSNNASSTYSDAGDEEVNNLRSKVEDSGAVPLAEADVIILTDWNAPAPVAGKERVYFVSGGELEKLVVNVLLVVYVP